MRWLESLIANWSSATRRASARCKAIWTTLIVWSLTGLLLLLNLLFLACLFLSIAIVLLHWSVKRT